MVFISSWTPFFIFYRPEEKQGGGGVRTHPRAAGLGQTCRFVLAVGSEALVGGGAAVLDP